jgi:hypothetical protein
MATEDMSTTAIANLAARGRPAPSSFDTRTLIAALNPKNTMICHPKRFVLHTNP